MPSGILILHKEGGMTSHTAVARARKLYGLEKAGHTGTLDPMATGVLPVLLGRAVKASAFVTDADKHYIATLRLGITTDTEDITGTVLSQTDALPTAEQVVEVARRFVGALLQTPPMYSALKVGGKKLVDLAREGKEVPREPRPVTVYRLDVTPLDSGEYTLDVVCSKGTYIRTLCADIGAALGCGGVMTSLCRAEAAGFSLAEAHTLSELEAMTEEERLSLLVPVEHLFRHLPAVRVEEFYARLLRHGQRPAKRKLKINYPVGTRLRLVDANGFFALGEIPEEDPDTVRAVTLFVL